MLDEKTKAWLKAAIHKQIPRQQKLVIPGVGTIFICPSCLDPVNRIQNYCPQCGQKLDWSNSEEKETKETKKEKER